MDPRAPTAATGFGSCTMAEGDIGKLVPMRDPRLRVIEFNFDVSDFMGVGAAAEFPARPAPRRSYIAAFRRSNDDGQRSPVMIDRLTARMLELSDGTRTALEVVRELDQQGSTSSEADNVKWMENLFVQGLISLRDERVDPSSNLY